MSLWFNDAFSFHPILHPSRFCPSHLSHHGHYLYQNQMYITVKGFSFLLRKKRWRNKIGNRQHYVYYFYCENKIYHLLKHLRQYIDWGFFSSDNNSLITNQFILEIYWIVTIIIPSHTNIVDELFQVWRIWSLTLTFDSSNNRLAILVLLLEFHFL